MACDLWSPIMRWCFAGLLLGMLVCTARGSGAPLPEQHSDLGLGIDLQPNTAALASGYRRLLQEADTRQDGQQLGTEPLSPREARYDDNISVIRKLHQQVVDSPNPEHRHHRHPEQEGDDEQEEGRQEQPAADTAAKQAAASLDLRIFIYPMNSSFTSCSQGVLCDGYDLYSLDFILPKLVAASAYVTKVGTAAENSCLAAG